MVYVYWLVLFRERIHKEDVLFAREFSAFWEDFDQVNENIVKVRGSLHEQHSIEECGKIKRSLFETKVVIFSDYYKVRTKEMFV